MANGETMEQLVARFAVVQKKVAKQEARTVQLVNEADQAAHRWRLRANIEGQEGKLAKQQEINNYHAMFRRELDDDLTMPSFHKREGVPRDEHQRWLPPDSISPREDIDWTNYVTRRSSSGRLLSFPSRKTLGGNRPQ